MSGSSASVFRTRNVISRTEVLTGNRVSSLLPDTHCLHPGTYTRTFRLRLHDRFFPCRDRIFPRPRPCKRASRFPHVKTRSWKLTCTRRVFLVEKLACQLFDENFVTKKNRQILAIYTTRFPRRGKSDRVNAALVRAHLFVQSLESFQNRGFRFTSGISQPAVRCLELHIR